MSAHPPTPPRRPGRAGRHVFGRVVGAVLVSGLVVLVVTRGRSVVEAAIRGGASGGESAVQRPLVARADALGSSGYGNAARDSAANGSLDERLDAASAGRAQYEATGVEEDPGNDVVDPVESGSDSDAESGNGGADVVVTGSGRDLRPDTGTLVELWEDGTVRKEETYRDGDLSGPFAEYFPDGSVAIEGQYEEGLKVGLWREYHPDGTPRSIGGWQDGRPDGEWTTYYTNGQVKATGWFNRGLREGNWGFYDRFGGMLEGRSGYYQLGRRMVY